MARKEKMSEERRKLIQEFIKSNDFKTAGDIQEAIKDLFKDTIQEMLNAELTEHLGYEKNEYTDNNENYRNGYSQKTVHSSEGDITLDIPRDRQGTFDPVIVEKGQKDISNIEDKIIFLNIKFGFLKVKKSALFMASSSNWSGNAAFNRAIGVRTSLELP